ncbi:MAG: hypothetical protein NTV49_07220 [Kiritimatiellaeota bacterium]|nr:hypothetical protein [Kiritimatiellota bacterium]
MKRSANIVSILWLALGVAGGQNTPAPVAGQPGLSDLKKQFETVFRDLQRQEREAAKLSQQRYLAGLTALEEAWQVAGSNLTVVLAVDMEKKRFEQSDDIPANALATELPALRKLQDGWRAQTAALPQEQARKIVAAGERYLQTLANLQKGMAAQNDTNGVAEVIAEKDRLLSNSRVCEAVALLQASNPADPASLLRRLVPQSPAVRKSPVGNHVTADEFIVKLRNGQELTFSRVITVDSGDRITLLTSTGTVLLAPYQLPEATLQAFQQVKRQKIRVRGEIAKCSSAGFLLSQAQYKAEPKIASGFYSTTRIRRLGGATENQWNDFDDGRPIMVLQENSDPTTPSSSGMSWQGAVYPAGAYVERYTGSSGYPRTRTYKCFALTPAAACFWAQGHPGTTDPKP